MYIIKRTGIVFLLIIAASCTKQNVNEIIDLSGEWQFKIDPDNEGIVDKWYAESYSESVMLPGSMAENDKGYDVDLNTDWTGSIFDSSYFFLDKYEKYRDKENFKVPFWLQPRKHYVGAAWYQKVVKIPADWEQKSIRLFLERCHWETQVWIDTLYIGMENSLGTPNVYDLSNKISPGKHMITIRIDNRVKEIDVGRNSHSISDHTQGNWNGITGKMELQASGSIFAEDIQIYPVLSNNAVKVDIKLKNISDNPEQLTVKLKAIPLFSDPEEEPETRYWNISLTENEYQFQYPMGKSPRLWDEFNPNLYSMSIQIHSAKGLEYSKDITFGMRDFKTENTYFTINGKRIFLRGTLDCAIFPKTGYPPTDTSSWMKILRTAKAYGLNHLRFHSWCPPEAAFEAADILGVYLQVECSSWANWSTTVGDGLPVDKYIYEEGDRILKHYGNHSSFCMLLYGNEPGGRNQRQWLGELINYWKQKDARRVYSSGAGWPVIPENDFNSISSPRIQQWGQGLESIINAEPPRSNYDWSDEIISFEIPTVSHEIGQWCVYPDFKEIPEYTGVLQAKNFEIFKETLEKNNMSHLADSFLVASGKLQALCYKADIEAALRTPGFGGFQLLSLYDFPGQGTALVGILNSFWEEKGYISPDEFRSFCNTTVPLIRLPKMIYTANETLEATVEIAHFGDNELTDVIPSWKLMDKKGEVIAEEQLSRINIPITNALPLGSIKYPLDEIIGPKQLKLVVTVGNFQNSWDLWVYPETNEPVNNKDIVVAREWNDEIADYLNSGGRVLLTPKKGSLKPGFGGDIKIGFSSIFWNTAWTNGQAPHTLGILCNPEHPALESFPTEFHSNWQWWDAMSHSNAINISNLPHEINPIVRVIDDWFENRPLALIFEVNVGKGKLIVSGIDLLSNSDQRPEARQLLYSLKQYMAGETFNPAVSIELNNLKKLFIY